MATLSVPLLEDSAALLCLGGDISSLNVVAICL